MKLRVLPLLIVLCAGLGLRPAAGAVNVSFSAGIGIHAAADFYSPLTPYGSWVEVGPYGRCFHPTQIAAGWRPYTMGHWEYTDVGWYWMSDEPFGWATYHYGSWVEDPNYGWVWIPGTEWSPAWVTWRESDSYIGWAPCGPNLAVAAPSLFVFVEFGRFCDPIRPSAVIVNNTTIINRTRVVNNFRSESRSFDGGQHRMRVNAGPDVQRVQHATGRNFNPTPISTAVQRTNERRSNEQPQRENLTTPEQRNRERNATTPEQRNRELNRERSVTTPEQQRQQQRSATTPEKPAVQEPSGAQRDNKPSREAPAPPAPRESTKPSAPREAPAPPPAPEKPAIKEPSGATREAPAPSTQVPREAPAPSKPQEEHRTVAPQASEHPAPAPTERAPARAQGPEHAAPAAHEAPHGPPVQQDRRNENDRRPDQP